MPHVQKCSWHPLTSFQTFFFSLSSAAGQAQHGSSFSHLSHQNLTGETEARGLGSLLGGRWGTTGKMWSRSEGEVLELVQQHATVPRETQREAKIHRGIFSVFLRNRGDFPEQLWRRNNLC